MLNAIGTLGRLIALKQPKVAALTSLAATLGVTGVDDEAIRPRLEAVGIPELRQVSPRRHEGVLRGVLGQGRVAQDPARHGVQAVSDAIDQQVERLFVAVHRSLDEPSLHPSPVVAGPHGGADHRVRVGEVGERSMC
jgi:hypothetical protein